MTTASTLADSNTTIGSIVIQNPPAPTGSLLSLIAPGPNVVSSIDGKFTALIYWNLLGVAVSEGASSSYSLTSTQGTDVTMETVNAINQAIGNKASATFLDLKASVSQSFGWSSTNCESLEINQSESVEYSVNIAPNTVSVIWQLQVTYQCNTSGLNFYHKVGKYECVQQAEITDFDNFQIQLAEGLIQNLPPSPTIDSSGNAVYPNPDAISPLVGNYAYPPSWEDRMSEEVTTAMSIYIQAGVQLEQLIPNRNSIRRHDSPCPPGGNDSPSDVANAVIAGENNSKRIPNKYGVDGAQALTDAVQAAIDNNLDYVHKSTAAFNYASPGPIGFNFPGSGNITLQDFVEAICEDRYFIMMGGWGTVGGSAAASQRFHNAVTAENMNATFSWTSQANASGNVTQNPGSVPYCSIDFGASEIKTTGNSTSDTNTEKFSNSIGFSLPLTADGVSLGSISDAVTSSFTKSTTNKYALSINKQQAINRTFSFSVTDQELPFYYIYTIWQLNINYGAPDDAGSSLTDSPDIFIIRSQTTHATGGPIFEK